MRVIAGSAKGRKLKVPSDTEVRPTQDRVREALFSMLGADVRDRVVLDLFAGTGALGIEALSRGASHATFVDANPLCVTVIQENIRRCGFAACTDVLRQKVPEGLSRIQGALSSEFDLVFLDPPYNVPHREALLEKLIRFSFIRDHARIVFEHSPKRPFSLIPKGISVLDQRRFGDTVLTFFDCLKG